MKRANQVRVWHQNIMDKPETSSASSSKSHPNQSSQKHHQHHQNRPHRREFQPKTHSVNKRPIAKPFQRDCDVYVSNKSNFQVNSILLFKIFTFWPHRTWSKMSFECFLGRLRWNNVKNFWERSNLVKSTCIAWEVRSIVVLRWHWNWYRNRTTVWHTKQTHRQLI